MVTVTEKVLPEPGWTVPRLEHPEASQQRDTGKEEGNPFPDTWTLAPGAPEPGLTDMEAADALEAPRSWVASAIRRRTTPPAS
jgi:hypothetical protein